MSPLDCESETPVIHDTFKFNGEFPMQARVFNRERIFPINGTNKGKAGRICSLVSYLELHAGQLVHDVAHGLPNHGPRDLVL